MRRSGSLVLGATLAVVLAVGGCTSGSEQTSESSSASAAASSGVSTTSAAVSTPVATPTIPADVPLTGKNLNAFGETPPVMPILATKHTPEGAVAFARFFMQTIDWGYASTSAAYMNHYFQASCVECRNVRTFLVTAVERNGYYRGSRVTISAASSGGVGGEFAAEYSTVVTSSATAWDVVDVSGKSLGSGPASEDAKDEIWTAWLEGGWTVVKMVTTL